MRTTVLSVILAALIGFFLFGVNYAPAQVPQERFKTKSGLFKIVYKIEKEKDVAKAKEECKRQGGTFNECGSPCDESGDEPVMCPAVCAYTCEEAGLAYLEENR